MESNRSEVRDKLSALRFNVRIEAHQSALVRTKFCSERNNRSLVRASVAFDGEILAVVPEKLSVDAHETRRTRANLSFVRINLAFMRTFSSLDRDNLGFMHEKLSELAIKPSADRDNLELVRTNPTFVHDIPQGERHDLSVDGHPLRFRLWFLPGDRDPPAARAHPSWFEAKDARGDPMRPRFEQTFPAPMRDPFASSLNRSPKRALSPARAGQLPRVIALYVTAGRLGGRLALVRSVLLGSFARKPGSG